jgi:CheY-like chemotaxis protein
MNSRLILIVEDDRTTRSFLADQLVADGYRILLAEKRQHALNLLAQHRPQLVLADINGHTLGLLDAVRNSDGLASKIDPNTPMIILAGRAHELDRVRVFDHGGDDVIPKAVLLPRAPRPHPRPAPPRPRAQDHAHQPGRRAHRRPPGTRPPRQPPARPARRQGVRAAANADRRADPHVHPPRAAPRRLGLHHPEQHNGRQPRSSAQKENRQPRAAARHLNLASATASRTPHPTR